MKNEIKRMQELVSQMKSFSDANRLRKLIDEMQTQIQLKLVDRSELAGFEQKILHQVKERFVTIKKWTN